MLVNMLHTALCFAVSIPETKTKKAKNSAMAKLRWMKLWSLSKRRFLYINIKDSTVLKSQCYISLLQGQEEDNCS